MQLLQSFICVLLLLTSGVLSVPTRIYRGPQRKGRSFKVERVRRDNYVPNGPASLRKAYRKYGFTLPEDFGVETLDFQPKARKPKASATATQAVAAAQDAVETGAVAAKSVSGDTEFVAAVTIGGQTIMMDFDTGSSDLWVFNTKLPTADQTGHTIYDPSKSSNASTLEGATFDISYGDGSYATGTVGYDTVNIGGAVVAKQAVELPNNVSSSFIEDTSSNGLVGFAFSTLNTVKPTAQKTFFDNVAADLDEPVLTALLKSGSSSGQYELGTIDKSLFTGTMANISIDTTNGFWQFNSAQFSVGSSTTMQKITSAPIAIADTGTTLMLVAPEVASAYYEQVTDAQLSSTVGGYIFPCNADLPTINIAVGDNDLATVPASVLNFEEVGTNTTSGESVCYGGLQSNSGSDLQIFGDVFLKSMFVVFDQRGPSLGLATPAA